MIIELYKDTPEIEAEIMEEDTPMITEITDKDGNERHKGNGRGRG